MRKKTQKMVYCQCTYVIRTNMYVKFPTIMYLVIFSVLFCFRCSTRVQFPQKSVFMLSFTIRNSPFCVNLCVHFVADRKWSLSFPLNTSLMRKRQLDTNIWFVGCIKFRFTYSEQKLHRHIVVSAVSMLC